MEATENWIETVRRRPEMYFGSVHDGYGLASIVLELIANVIDRHLVGEAHRVDVVLHEDGLIVQDDGPGIPIHDVNGRSFLERVFTEMHVTPTRDGHAPHIHLLLHGVGVAPICAVATSVVVESAVAGQRYRARFERGQVADPLRCVGDAPRSGTRVEVTLDREIFRVVEWPTGHLQKVLRDLAMLFPGFSTSIRVHHEFGPYQGLGAMVARMGHARRLHPTPILCHGEVGLLKADIAMLFQDTPIGPTVASFCNAKRTAEGGSHVRGLERGLERALQPFVPKRHGRRPRVRYSRFGTGLCAAVSVMLIDPVFDSPTRDRLASPEAAALVERTVHEGVAAVLKEDAALRNALLRRSEVLVD